MLTRISQLLGRAVNGWIILFLLLIVVAISQLAIQPFSERLAGLSGGSGLIDLKFGYTPQFVHELIATYGDEGRAAYRRFTSTYDVVFPVAYSLLLSLLISWLLARGTPADSRLRLLNLVPLGAWAFDWLENAFIIALLSRFPDQSPLIAWLASLATTTKWAFSALTLIIFVLAVTLALKVRRRVAQ